MKQSSHVRRAAVCALVLSTVLGLAACSAPGTDGSVDVPEAPDKGLEAVTAEGILTEAPAELTPKESFEEPADGGVARFNTATRTFSAVSEAAAAAAAEELRQAALGDGWTGGVFEDPDAGGVPAVTLTKGSLVLDISYTTDLYIQSWPDDEGGYEVRMVLTDEPTTDVVPTDGEG
jgi:hypothetical protein